MRRAILIAVITLAGCQSEPDFDERYAATEKQLRDKASEIDSELVKHQKAADAAVDGEGDGSGEGESKPSAHD